MTIGIIGAMDEEIDLLLSNMTDQKEETIGNVLFIKGNINDRDVVLLRSGIGKVNAAMATTIMHERYAPSVVINTGSAGGFSKELSVGDVIISTGIVYHDVDVTAFDYSYGQVPGMPQLFPADPYLIATVTEAVKQLDVQYGKGIIATGDSFMEDPSHVETIKEIFPEVIAAEMEGAAIAQVCYQYNKPFVIIRALSDIAGKESSVSFDNFLKQAAENAANLIINVIKIMKNEQK